jgi:hypothetical protein
MKLLTVLMLLHAGHGTVTINPENIATMRDAREGFDVGAPFYGPYVGDGCIIRMRGGEVEFVVNEHCATISMMARGDK